MVEVILFSILHVIRKHDFDLIKFKLPCSAKSEQEGRLVKETDMRRRALHVSEGRADKYDYQG